MGLDWTEVRAASETYSVRFVTPDAIRHCLASRVRDEDRHPVRVEFDEVVAWCYDQFGSPYNREWWFSTPCGRIGFNNPHHALAFKMRWV